MKMKAPLITPNEVMLIGPSSRYVSPAPCEEDLQQHREQDQPNQRLHAVQKDRQFDVGQDDAQECEQCHDQIGLPVIGKENDEDEIESSNQLRSRIQSMDQRVALDVAPEQ